MKKNPSTHKAIIILLALIISPTAQQGADVQEKNRGETGQKDIIETVTVRNVRVAVRVYDGKHRSTWRKPSRL